MNVFTLRDQLIGDYSSYVKSFITIRDERVKGFVDAELEAGILWPDPLIQLNPASVCLCVRQSAEGRAITHAEALRLCKMPGTC